MSNYRPSANRGAVVGGVVSFIIVVILFGVSEEVLVAWAIGLIIGLAVVNLVMVPLFEDDDTL